MNRNYQPITKEKPKLNSHEEIQCGKATMHSIIGGKPITFEGTATLSIAISVAHQFEENDLRPDQGSKN